MSNEVSFPVKSALGICGTFPRSLSPPRGDKANADGRSAFAPSAARRAAADKSAAGLSRMLLTACAGYGRKKGPSENGAPFVQRPRMLDSQSRDKGSSPLGGAKHRSRLLSRLCPGALIVLRPPGQPRGTLAARKNHFFSSSVPVGLSFRIVALIVSGATC